MIVSMRLLLVAVVFSSAAAMRPHSLLHSNLANGQSEKTAVSDGTAAPRQVRIQFIRHAFSCANMVQQFAKKGSLKRWGGSLGQHFLRDPMLSECGAVRSASAGEMLGNTAKAPPDFVLSSSMLRAMETAAYMFPGSTITPVPYISENRHIDWELDNLPLDVPSQLMQLAKAIDSNRTDKGPLRSLAEEKKLDLRWMKDAKFGKEGSSSPRMSSDWEKFEDFMANVFLPQVDVQKYPHPHLLTIAIVSHSNFLKGIPDVKKYCSHLYSDKPANNQVLELLFDYSARVAGLGAGSEPIAEMVVDPFDSDQKMRDLLFGELAGSGPPWKETNGIETKVRRKLDAVPEQECINRINVAPPLKHFCQRDVGSVCVDELTKAFPTQWSRPKLKEIPDQAFLMAKAELDVVVGKLQAAKFSDEAQSKYTMKRQELESKVDQLEGQLEGVKCCVE